MKPFTYCMPAKLYFGENCISKNSDVFGKYGKKAIILTGKASAKKNGSLKDVTDALDKNKIEYTVFNKIEENPSVETIVEASKTAVAEKADFIIGIGGGSPMDSSKAVSFLAANPDKGSDFLFEAKEASHLPIVLVPTTAGTGSEATQYAILTNHVKKTKTGISKRTFADVAFLDGKYMLNLPLQITRNTAVDAFTHLTEAYLCNECGFLSDMLSETGMRYFKEIKSCLVKGEFTLEDREKLLLISTLAGMAIAQSQTSLPHAMGYYLTYFKHLSHGPSNAVFTKAFLDFVPEQDKVSKIMELTGFKDSSDLDSFVKSIVPTVTATEEEINYYTDEMMKVTGKLKTVNKPITRDDMYKMFKLSLQK
ncbi:MAG: iron-containing alcohol dehydrogenase family protein [Clostridia bacterium]|nr:iron-containing alcohol dehydrogenase family protein [Clostridia bacterium]